MAIEVNFINWLLELTGHTYTFFNAGMSGFYVLMGGVIIYNRRAFKIIGGNAMNKEQLLSNKEAASMLCLKTGTLNQMRWRKDNSIPYVKLGKAVRYKLSDIENYIESCTVK